MAKEVVIVSEGVVNAFKEAENYKGKISRFEAKNMIGSFMTYADWYNFAKMKGLTKAENVFDYIEKDHDGIYTAVFLVAE